MTPRRRDTHITMQLTDNTADNRYRQLIAMLLSFGRTLCMRHIDHQQPATRVCAFDELCTVFAVCINNHYLYYSFLFDEKRQLAATKMIFVTLLVNWGRQRRLFDFCSKVSLSVSAATKNDVMATRLAAAPRLGHWGRLKASTRDYHYH